MRHNDASDYHGPQGGHQLLHDSSTNGLHWFKSLSSTRLAPPTTQLLLQVLAPS